MADQIEKSVELRAPVERVWKALTDYEQFGTWFRVKLDGPFVPGEPTSGHVTYPGYEHLKFEVETVDLDEGRRFSFRWHPYAVDPDKDYSAEEPTLVEFRLEPTASGTRVTVTESGFDKLPAERRPDAMRMNDSGWTEQMKNIAAYVGS